MTGTRLMGEFVVCISHCKVIHAKLFTVDIALNQTAALLINLGAVTLPY